MYLFYCENCDMDFENQNPQKKEYTDPVFGNCWKYIAYCPKCNAECSEKPKHKPLKKEKPSMPLFRQTNCGTGPGCCG